MKSYLIYKHTNKINDKCYIGQTCKKPEYRWCKDGSGYKKKQKKFWNAIKKYGWDNFTHEILYTGLTIEEANKLERELIQKYNSITNGYNISEGGSNNPPSPVRAVYQLDKDKSIIAEYSCIADAERALGASRSHISECCKGTLRKSLGFYWCYVEDYATYEIKTKSNKVRTASSGNTVYQLDENKIIIAEYPSFLAAQRAVSSNKRCKGNEAVKECCLGKRISYCGFYWCLAVDYENFIAKGPIRCRIIKRIIKLDPDTLEILNCYENAADATRACNGAVKVNKQLLMDISGDMKRKA